jgi:hypothetical protein
MYLFWISLVLLGVILVGRLILRGIGRVALQRVPEEIQLVRAAADQALSGEAIERYREAFVGAGFSEAGAYLVEGIAGLRLQFFQHSDPAFYGVVYDHPQRGLRWINVVILFADDTSVTLTDMPDRGLDPRPGHEVVHCPGDRVDVLIRAAQEYAVQKPLRAFGPADLPSLFERAYRDGMAWRKQRGIRAGEVARVAQSRQGKN